MGHSIATMAGVLRDDAGSIGLVTANGGFLTKHALGVYSTEPPAGGVPVAPTCRTRSTRCRSRELGEQPDGAATVESWVVVHDREGAPERVLAACLVDDGRRAWAASSDAATVAEMRSGAEQIGRAVKIGPDGELRL